MSSITSANPATCVFVVKGYREFHSGLLRVQAECQRAVQPPSNGMTCPVICAALSEQGKMTASATSSGSHHRPCGTADNIAASAPGWRALIRSAVGVRTSPGATAFTRIPWVAYCSAADLVRPDTPCLEEDVSDNTGRADQASHGAVVHDGAPPALQHLGNLVFHGEPNARQVRRHNAVLFGRFYDARNRPH
jgi:hypothetical protein